MSGSEVADSIFEQLCPRIERLHTAGHAPGLATLLVGDDDASARYVGMKHAKAAEGLGCRSIQVRLSAGSSQQDVVDSVHRLNDDDAVDAILFQYPPPQQIDFEAALLELDPDKDVDGLHPANMGRLALAMPGPVPCTPAGIEALLAYYEIPVAGKEVCILGRGATLGRPLALLLSQKRPTANAAVTVVHTGVPDWVGYTRRADIVIAAGARGPRHPPSGTHHPRLGGGRRRSPLRGPQTPP